MKTVEVPSHSWEARGLVEELWARSEEAAFASRAGIGEDYVLERAQERDLARKALCDAMLNNQEPFVQLLLDALETGAMLRKVVDRYAGQCEGLEDFAYLDNNFQETRCTRCLSDTAGALLCDRCATSVYGGPGSVAEH